MPSLRQMLAQAESTIWHDEDGDLSRIINASADSYSGKRSFDTYSSSQTSGREQKEEKLEKVFAKRSAMESLSAFRSQNSLSFNEPHTDGKVFGLSGLDSLYRVTNASMEEISQRVKKKRVEEHSRRFGLLRRVDASQGFNLSRNWGESSMLSAPAAMSAGLNPSANLNLLSAWGLPTNSSFTSQNALEVAEMLQSMEVDNPYPWDLGDRPRTVQYTRQVFLRMLSEGDRTLLTRLAPLKYVVHVPDTCKFSSIYYNDVYAPLLAHHADRQQGTWSKTSSSFPASMRGIRTQIQLATLLQPGGDTQWMMQLQQMAVGVQRTLAMLVKNQLINQSVHRNIKPTEPTAHPTAEDFERNTLRWARMCGGTQKQDVGFQELVTEIRKNIDARGADSSKLCFIGVKEMIQVENAKLVNMIHFINGRNKPKIGIDDRGMNPQVWTPGFDFFDVSDSYTPDGADVISSISAKVRWIESYIIPGGAAMENEDKNVEVPGSIQIINERTDSYDFIHYKNALHGAWGKCPMIRGYQWYEYLDSIGMAKKSVAEFYEHFGILQKVYDAWHHNNASAPDANRSTLFAALAPRTDIEANKREKAKEDAKKKMEKLLKDLPANHDSPFPLNLFNTRDWNLYFDLCCEYHIPTFIDLLLLTEVQARAAMLIGVIPGESTMCVLMGDINMTQGFDAINKYITANLDFKVAVPCLQPRNIEAVPAAFFHQINRSQFDGRSFIDDSQVIDGVFEYSKRKGQFFVIPLWPTDRIHAAGAHRKLFSVTGTYPRVVEQQDDENSLDHYACAATFRKMFGIHVQVERPTGVLEMLSEAGEEMPILAYRAQYFYEVVANPNAKLSDRYKLIEGTGPRGPYVCEGHKLYWSGNKEVRLPKFVTEGADCLFNLRLV